MVNMSNVAQYHAHIYFELDDLDKYIDIGYPDICVIFETAIKEIKKINAKKEESISISALG